jgi:hypothetical protein
VKDKRTMAAIPRGHFHLFERGSGEDCSFMTSEGTGGWDGPPKKRQSPYAGLCLGWRVGLMVNVSTASLWFLLMGCLFYSASCLYLKTSHSAVLVPGANLTISLF